MGVRSLNVNEAFQGEGVQAELKLKSPEDPAEKTARLTKEDRAHVQAMWERKAILVAGIGFLIAIALTAIGLLCFSSSEVPKTWSTGILSSIVGGFMGFLVGKGTKDPA